MKIIAATIIAFFCICGVSVAQQTTDKNRKDISDTSKALGGDRVKSTEGGTGGGKSSSQGRLGDFTRTKRGGN